MGFTATVMDPRCNGLVPIYRMWNEPISKYLELRLIITFQFSDDHFYTTNYNEMQQAQQGGYTLEGTVGYGMTQGGCGLVPLYRFWNQISTGMFL